MIKKVLTYYDDETGVIIKEKVFKVEDLAVSFKVGSSKQGKSSRFSKLFQMEDPKFDKASYYQYFFKCLLHLEMFTNRIVDFTTEWEDNSPMDEDSLSTLFETTKRTVRNFLEYCKNRNIIARIDKNGKLYGFMVNPIYALNGNKINSILYTMFKDSDLDKHIPSNELIKLKDYLKTKPNLVTDFHLKN